ncbi:MAG: DUF523 and DUF1722 domain-containing protein [Planctomycetes bacterium]|nr:DUF523 and DUF1722 domain-containing protein [Planctomycetota bacterium]
MKAAPIELGSWSHWHADERPLRLGVSQCLLGDEVRYDGGHARDRYVTDVLGRWFELVPVCPEVEAGLGTPRATLRLVDEGAGTRLVQPATGADLTDVLAEWSARRIEALRALDLDGFVLKRGSPSCGLERIKVYRAGMPAGRNESGVFARALRERWPALPVEEEGRLNDAGLRERFVERAFCRNRWRTLVARGLSRRALIEFHGAHKLLLLAHDEAGYRRLGRLVGSAGQLPDEELFGAYEAEFQAAMSKNATRKRHVNVMQHALGHLKRLLDPAEKQEVLTCIEDYHAGLLPLIVPLTVLRYLVRRHGVEYLQGQLYFDPHPKELMLRNHA